MTTEAKTTRERGHLTVREDATHDKRRGWIDVMDGCICVAAIWFDETNGFTRTDAVANARLFIAAGKLLNALNELLEISKTDAWGEGSMRLDDALSDARTAIAAATQTEE